MSRSMLMRTGVVCAGMIATAALAQNKVNDRDGVETQPDAVHQPVMDDLLADGSATDVQTDGTARGRGPGHHGRHHHRRPLAVCGVSCRQQARLDLEACIADGGTPPECRASVREALADCLAEDCACEIDCRQAGREILEACIADGGAPPECRSEARAAVRNCLETNCGYDFECLAGCHESGHDIFEECVEDGGTPPECRLEARDATQACAADCFGD